MAVEGRGHDAQPPCDLDHGDLGVAQQRLGGGDVLGLQGRGPATGAAAGASRLQAGERALADHAALELGQGREQVEHQPAARGGGVDRLGQRAQADALLAHGLDGLDQLLERARQAIQLPDHQRVALAHVAECRLELGPLTLRAGGLLLVDLGAPGRGERIQLQGEILLLGRDPGVADEHVSSEKPSQA